MNLRDVNPTDPHGSVQRIIIINMVIIVPAWHVAMEVIK